MTERAARLGRVLRVVAMGRRIADPADPLGREARARLPATCGLSAEGVELALTRYLETDPEPAHLDALVAASGSAATCHVLLAANVCTAALRAIAVAVATAPAVRVRPSRRDPVLAEILARELAADAQLVALGGSILRALELAPAAGDELHLHGSDETVAGLAASVPAGVLVRGHGTGLGVAIVGASDALGPAARAIADDVVAFDQRGCLSPRAVLVEGDGERADAFAAALHDALGALGERVPRGRMDAQTLGEIALHRATLTSVGVWREGRDHAVGLDPEPRALPLPPAARVVHVVPADAPRGLALLSPWAPYITSIGSDAPGPLADAALALAPLARRARLGAMQHPPLDGPVDLRRR